MFPDSGFGNALFCSDGYVCFAVGLSDHKPLLFFCQMLPSVMELTLEFCSADCFFKNDRGISGFISEILIPILGFLSVTAGVGHVMNRDVVSLAAISIEFFIVSSV